MALAGIRKLIIDEEAREGTLYREISSMNALFRDGAVEIGRKAPRRVLASSGREVPYVTVTFKQEGRRVVAYFLKDHAAWTAAELAELGISDGEKTYLSYPGFEGIWLRMEDPAGPDVAAPTDVASADDAGESFVDSNIGKRVRPVTKASNMVELRDPGASGVLLEEFHAPLRDPGELRAALDRLAPVSSGHKKVVKGFAALVDEYRKANKGRELGFGRLRFAVFRPLVRDFFGASVEGEVLIHESLMPRLGDDFDPENDLPRCVALFHEIGHFLTEAKRLGLTYDQTAQAIAVRFYDTAGTSGEMITIPLSSRTLDYLQAEGWPAAALEKNHYLLRLLQEELFPGLNARLTALVRERLAVEEEKEDIVSRIIAETGSYSWEDAFRREYDAHIPWRARETLTEGQVAARRFVRELVDLGVCGHDDVETASQLLLFLARNLEERDLVLVLDRLRDAAADIREEGRDPSAFRPDLLLRFFTQGWDTFTARSNADEKVSRGALIALGSVFCILARNGFIHSATLDRAGPILFDLQRAILDLAAAPLTCRVVGLSLRLAQAARSGASGDTKREVETLVTLVSIFDSRLYMDEKHRALAEKVAAALGYRHDDSAEGAFVDLDRLAEIARMDPARTDESLDMYLTAALFLKERDLPAALVGDASDLGALYRAAERTAYVDRRRYFDDFFREGYDPNAQERLLEQFAEYMARRPELGWQQDEAQAALRAMGSRRDLSDKDLSLFVQNLANNPSLALNDDDDLDQLIWIAVSGRRYNNERDLLSAAAGLALRNEPALTVPFLDRLVRSRSPDLAGVFSLEAIFALTIPAGTAVVDRTIPYLVALAPDSYLYRSIVAAVKPYIHLSADPVIAAHRDQIMANISLVNERNFATIFGPDRETYCDLVFADANRTIAEERFRLFGLLKGIQASPEICALAARFLGGYPREGRLAATRGLCNLLTAKVLTERNDIADWRSILGGAPEQEINYIRDFGFLADALLARVYMLLARGTDPQGSELGEYRLDALGVTATGAPGVRQFAEKVVPIRMRFIESKGTIDPRDLESPLVAAFIGSATGYYSAVWGHGSFLGIPLPVFAQQFFSRQGGHRALDPALAALPDAAIPVQRAGTVTYTLDEERAFERFRALMREVRADPPDAGETKRELLGLLDGAKEMLAERQRDDLPPPARKGIAMRLEAIGRSMDAIAASSTVPELVAGLLGENETRKLFDKDNRLQEAVQRCLISLVFEKNPELRDAIPEGVTEGVPFILRFKYEYLAHAVEGAKQKTILPAFKTVIFESAEERRKAVGNATMARAFITKGFVGALAPDIGDACYSAVNDLMGYPTLVGAVIFTTGDGPDAEYAGSMLILENTVEGEKVWILRAINPRERFLAEHNARSFLEGAITYAWSLADAAGVRRVLAPGGQTGALTNRAAVAVAMSAFYAGETVALDRGEALNGYSITSSCRPVIRPGAAAVASAPERRDAPAPEESAPQDEPEAPASLDRAHADASRIHEENIALTPAIPQGTIRCHIIADAILPVGQRAMLKKIEKNMRGEEYREKVVSLSVADPARWVEEAEALMARQRRMHAGYEVQFDIACPDLALARAMHARGVKALAFKPCADGTAAQVEGILLALRALGSGRAEALKAAFRTVAGQDLPPELMAVDDIDALSAAIVFILPAVSLADYNEIRMFNDLVRNYIESAA